MTRLFLPIMILGLLVAACGSSSDNGQTGEAPDTTIPTATAGSDNSAIPGMSDTATPGMPGMGGEETPMDEMSFDQMFIAAMIPHHESATEMAKVAEKQAEHPEINQLAAAIITAQEKEIDQMRAWYKVWYGADQIPPVDQEMMDSMTPGMDMGDMGMKAADLTDAKPFDRAFIDAMIPHHESAIAMAETALKQADRPEIRRLAEEIISSQQKEIVQMKEWRKAWYGS